LNCRKWPFIYIYFALSGTLQSSSVVFAVATLWLLFLPEKPYRWHCHCCWHFASFQAIYEFIEQHAACVPLIGTSWRMSSAVVNVN